MQMTLSAFDMARQAAVAAQTEIDFFALAFGAGFVVALVLLVLIFLSVTSWGIIIYKFRQIKRAEQETAEFLRIFWESRRLDQIYD